jgi:DNA modification methylase
LGDLLYNINEIRNTILCGNATDILKDIPDESIHSGVTSPPYWTLRSYKTTPYIWGGDKNCNHEWGEKLDMNLDRRTHIGGSLGSDKKGGGRDTAHKNGNGEICLKCNAWRGELGTEPTPQLYISHLLDIFKEIKRVLRNDGTLWVVIGDCYTPQSSHKGGTPYDRFKKEQNWSERSDSKDIIPSWGKAKDLVGIPWRFAFAMQDDGWWLRNDIIWAKANPLPSSVEDRCVSSHEHCFLFTKSGDTTFWTHRDKSGTRKKPQPDYRYYDKLNKIETIIEPPSWKTELIEGTEEKRWKRYNLWKGHDYYFDHLAIREPATVKNISSEIKYGGTKYPNKKFGGTKYPGEANNTYSGNDYIPTGMRNKRDVWQIATESCRDSHFAVYPRKLILPMILASTSEGGVCKSCGSPYTRLTKKSEPLDEWKKQCGADSSGEYKGMAVKQYKDAKAQNASDVKRRILEGMVNIETIGWVPSCNCIENSPSPAIVIDPFFGAGTTGIVAGITNRDYIGIELNQEFIKLAYDRIPREIEKEKEKSIKNKLRATISTIAENENISFDVCSLTKWVLFGE